MSRKYQQTLYHMNVKVSLKIANVTRIKSGMMIKVGVSVEV